jgi:hypothetical protein
MFHQEYGSRCHDGSDQAGYDEIPLLTFILFHQ